MQERERNKEIKVTHWDLVILGSSPIGLQLGRIENAPLVPQAQGLEPNPQCIVWLPALCGFQCDTHCAAVAGSHFKIPSSK